MSKEIHKGVGLLISNKDHNQFFIQIKDEQYPYKEWRGACAFWGGAIEEEDQDERTAVERELEEEIPEAAFLLKDIQKNKINRYWIDNKSVVQPFWLSIYEVTIENEQLQKVAKSTVLEGKGLLISKSDLLQKKWIWGMDFIFKEYLELKENM